MGRTRGFAVAIEINAALRATAGIDGICVSPKAGIPPVQAQGDEPKRVFPHPALEPEARAGLHVRHRRLQPMDGPDQAADTRAAVACCRADALALQTRTVIGIY